MANPGPAVTNTPEYALAFAGSRNPSTWGMLAQSSVAITAPTDTTEDILATVNIDPSYMGFNSRLRIWTYWTCTNNANVKTVRVRHGGISGTAYYSGVLTSLANGIGYCEITAQGANLLQQGWGVTYVATPAIQFNAQSTGTLDLTAAQTLVITSQKATGADVLTLVSYSVEHYYAP
jgi:hypothetical protein